MSSPVSAVLRDRPARPRRSFFAAKLKPESDPGVSASPHEEPSMDRRLVLTGLAAAVAIPAIAQTQQPAPIPVTPQPTGNQPGGAAGALYGGATRPMVQAEIQHVQETLAAGTVALQTSNIALQKAQNPKVKQFAEFEREEQTTLADILRSMQEPNATASAGSAGAATAPEIPADKAAIMQQLQGTAAGADFDRMYVRGQLQGHQDLLRIQDRYLQSNSRNREHVAVARLSRGRIQEHIVELQDLQRELGG
jgi:putative membrane protein